MTRLVIRSGRVQPMLIMAGHRPQFHHRPARLASERPGWRTLPVEGTRRWRQITAADRRAKRAKLFLILLAMLVGVAVAVLKGN
jgi:hypothetical protein